MFVAGIDVSTHAIDLVLLDDYDQALWRRYELDGHDALERLRQVARQFPGRGSVFFDDVVAVGIERPAGRYSVDKVAMFMGAVVACLPWAVLVQWWRPAEWRKACGLPGNAPKDSVMTWVKAGGAALSTHGWPQDACDAWAIAYATRQALVTQQAA